MENVIVTTLKAKIQDLKNIIYTKREEVLATSIQTINTLLTSIDPAFKDWTVQLSEYGMTIKKLIDGYHCEACEIKFSYTNEKDTWKKIYQTHNVQISWSSRNCTENYEFQSGIIIGILCQLQQTNNIQWTQLINSFVLHHVNTDALDEKQMWEDIRVMEQQVKAIETGEKEIKFQQLFNQGSMELVEKVRYKTGNSKHSFVSADNFQWEIKPGQKTGKLTTIAYRGTASEHKHIIKERMPLEDLKSFILGYSHKVKVG